MSPELRVLDFPAKPPKKEKKRRKYEMADGTFKAKPMINGKRHTVRGKSTKEVEEKIALIKREYKGALILPFEISPSKTGRPAGLNPK